MELRRLPPILERDAHRLSRWCSGEFAIVREHVPRVFEQGQDLVTLIIVCGVDSDTEIGYELIVAFVCKLAVWLINGGIASWSGHQGHRLIERFNVAHICVPW